jgi:hypothetical protein
VDDQQQRDLRDAGFNGIFVSDGLLVYTPRGNNTNTDLEASLVHVTQGVMFEAAGHTTQSPPPGFVWKRPTRRRRESAGSRLASSSISFLESDGNGEMNTEITLVTDNL